MTMELEQDLRTRWAPSAAQISHAVELLAPYPQFELSVLVPIALNYKDHGIWNDGVEVEPIEGVFILADMYGEAGEVATLLWSDARQLVCTIAKQNSLEGTGSYAIIDPDGTWSVFEV